MATLRVTNLRGRTANVAPDLPDGANITGVCTATSFVGSGAALTGIDATSIKDSGDTVRVLANTSGIEVTGVSTFSDSATFSSSASFASGVTVTGNAVATSKFRGNDGVKLSLGDSEDLQIQHDGNNAIIDSTTGHTYIRNTDAQFIFQPKMDENSLILKPDGAVEAYHDNSKKLETSATGITVTGTVAATSYTGDGSNLTGAGGAWELMTDINMGSDYGSANLDITGFTTAYREYKVNITNLRTVGGNAKDIRVRFWNVDGGTLHASDYNYSGYYHRVDGSASGNLQTSSNSHWSICNGSATTMINCVITIPMQTNAANTWMYANAMGRFQYSVNAGSRHWSDELLEYAGANDKNFTGMRFFNDTDSTNFMQGRIAVYRCKF